MKTRKKLVFLVTILLFSFLLIQPKVAIAENHKSDQLQQTRLDHNFIQPHTLAGGYYHTCFVTPTGSVKCWGKNNYGQLGNGTTSNQLTPVDVVGLDAEVVSITSGWNHTCVLTALGEVKCWGLNDYGQLGNGNYVNQSTPVQVYGIFSTVEQIASEGEHTCALFNLDTFIVGALMYWEN